MDHEKKPIFTRAAQAIYSSPHRRWRLVSVLLALGGLALVLLAGSITHKCPNAHWTLSFSPTAERARATACPISNATLNRSYWVDTAAAVVYGAGLAALLLAWWRFGWRSRRQGSFEVARIAALVPLAAAAFDVVENVLVLAFVDIQTRQLPVPRQGIHVPTKRLIVPEWLGPLLGGVGTAKWILVALALLAAVLTLYGARRFARIKLWDAAAAAPVDTRPSSEDEHAITMKPGNAICLSGGGIRSAAFAWGALATLELEGHLVPEATLYSVSGGGYTATSLTTRRGFTGRYFELEDPDPIPSPPPEPDEKPYRYVRRNRHYLDGARGGIAAAVLRSLGTVVLNLSVIGAGLFVLSVPVGLLARTTFGQVDMTLPDTTSPWDVFRPGAWWIFAVPLSLAVVAFVLSCFCLTKRRLLMLKIVGATVGLALASFVVMIALPWLAVQRASALDRDWTAVLPAFLLWAVGIGVALLKPRLPKLAPRLGGVITVGVMVYFAALFVDLAALPDKSQRWWFAVIGLVGVYLVVIDWSGVQWWSLHPIYRDRLAGTFVLKRNHAGREREGMIDPQPSKSWLRWSEITGERGPRHVVCAATHRADALATGLRSVSFRFSTDGVEYFVPRVEDGRVVVDRYAQSAAWLDGVVGATTSGPFRPNARSSVIGAAAMSGAAFNSVMGRQSKGSTDSLFAMLNLRLGVWLPNPRFETTDDKTYPRAGLRYLFHEVFGIHDIDDPFIHVSDGGHWENLGLVEALRERHKLIYVVDASGGKVDPTTAGPSGGGFAALHEARDLARIELRTEVRLQADDLLLLRPDPVTGRAKSNWARGEVVYHTDSSHKWSDCSCPRGEIIYVKAVVCDATPEPVLVHANVDRVFPDYPTGDQFLSDDEFRALVRLGRSAMHRALGLGGEG